jgi:hypothetical protein
MSVMVGYVSTIQPSEAVMIAILFQPRGLLMAFELNENNKHVLWVKQHPKKNSETI